MEMYLCPKCNTKILTDHDLSKDMCFICKDKYYIKNIYLEDQDFTNSYFHNFENVFHTTISC
jgi:hypothetical protein